MFPLRESNVTTKTQKVHALKNEPTRRGKSNSRSPMRVKESCIKIEITKEFELDDEDGALQIL